MSSVGIVPSFFLPGIAFGTISGFLEGYCLDRICVTEAINKTKCFGSRILPWIAWGLWHMPVVGAPHGAYWFAFFLTFVLSVIAVRILIVWVYVHTKSLLLAQLMHASFSITMITITPTNASAGQDMLHYILFAVSLWAVVAFIVARLGKKLSMSKTSYLKVNSSSVI